jgi:uridine monophosphate synthetase
MSKHPDSGNSLVQEVGLKVSDVVVLIDREQGGREHLLKSGLQLHAAFTLSFIVTTLMQHHLLSAEVVDAVKTFIAENQTTAAVAGV